MNLSATVNTISGFKFSKWVASSIIAKPVDLAIVVGFSPSIIEDTVANSLKPSVINDVDANDEIKMLLDDYQYDKRNNKRLQRYLHALDIKRNTDSRKVLKWCWI